MPACGVTPDAMPNAIASGSATTPTVRPAIEVGRERAAAVVRGGIEQLGPPGAHGMRERARVTRAGSPAVHLAEHRERLVQVRVEVLPQQVEHLDQHGVAQGVVDLVADLAVDDDLLGAQHREVLGQVGLLDAAALDQRARADSSPSLQGLDDRDAGGVRQRLEDLGLELAERVGHRCEYITKIEYSKLCPAARLHPMTPPD